jgi:hypothetical protein
MRSILPKYDDLDRVAEEAAIKIFMEDMKKCSKCGEVKSTGEFSKYKRAKDGLQSQCKACVKAYREANKDKIAEKKKAYYKANKENHADRSKAYRESNKEKIAEWHKAYYEKNKEKVAESQKAYQKANKDKIAEKKKAYQKANKEKITEYNKAWREANKDAIAERKKTWQEANKDAIAESQKAYYKANKEKLAEKAKAYHEARRLEHIEQLKQIIEPNTDGKWIYIMQCGIYHKIGISSDPLLRVEQIENRTQAPTELIYLAKANYGRTIDTEQIIHHELSSLNVPMPYANAFNKDHVSREWFYGSLDKMIEIVSQYAAISEVD